MRLELAGYSISDDPAEVDVDVVWAYLSQEAYWARWRERSDFEAQLASAWRVISVFDAEGAQIGFARAMSDGVALAYLADVFVLSDHRAEGLGQALVRAMIDDGPGAKFRWMLHTADAHGLYGKFGFGPADETYLERPSTM